MKLAVYFFLILGLSLVACKEEEDIYTGEEDILQYIQDNNLQAQSTPEGVYYVIENEGSGSRPTLTNTVVVNYEGRLLDGTKFDSSYDRGQPATFPLSGVIRGWQIGIPLFKSGGKGTLIVPPALGYGSNPPAGSPIPSNAVLVFDVELLDVR